MSVDGFDITQKNCRRIVGIIPNALLEGKKLHILNNNKILSVGDVYDRSKIKDIYKSENKKDEYIIKFYDLSKTSYFILPFVFKNKGVLKFDTHFLYSFLGYKLNNFYIAIKYTDDIEYFKLEKYLCTLSNYVNQIHCDDEMLFIFKLPDNDDINKIIQGKYSSISDEGKQKIIEFHNIKQPKVSKLYGIMYKTDTRREEINNLLKLNIDNSIEYLGEMLYAEPDDIDNLTKEQMIMYKDINIEYE